MAALLVIGPIFETDLLANQYGFRPEMDAKMAIRRAFWHITDHGRTEVADVDSKDYFNTIPHGPLMRCVARRIADGTVLAVIKAWLTAPIIERGKRGMSRARKPGTATVGRRRAELCRHYWRVCTSAAFCWRGTATVIAINSGHTSSTMPMTVCHKRTDSNGGAELRKR